MTKNDFVKELSEYCEFEETDHTVDTMFDSVEGYDSLAVMSIIAFTDENFGVKLTAAQLKDLTDFNSLISLIGNDKFD